MDDLFSKILPKTDLISGLSYQVPPSSPSGACSLSDTLTTFDLSQQLFSLPAEKAVAQHPKSVSLISRLYGLVEAVAQKNNIEWVGLYLRTKHEDGDVLLKVAYTGAPSRAIFPLTEQFATASNNSFCAMNGTRRIIQDTDAYSGPYYVCDSQVKSEYCAALFADGVNNFDTQEKAQVTGLIDAEAWRVDAFTAEIIAELEALGSLVGKIFKEGIAHLDN